MSQDASTEGVAASPSIAPAADDAPQAAVADPHASKIPPDHPGLRLSRPPLRLLKTGRVLGVIFCAGGLAATALVLGFTGTAQPSQQAGAGSAEDQPLVPIPQN